MKKSELRTIIREVLQEELASGSYLTEATSEENLIASYVVKNPEFERACAEGNAAKIMEIIDTEMAAINMYTPGAKKFRNDVLRLTQGKAYVSPRVGQNILFFAYNSLAKGIGLGACGKRVAAY